jgi:hypothetical protein
MMVPRQLFLPWILTEEIIAFFISWISVVGPSRRPSLKFGFLYTADYPGFFYETGTAYSTNELEPPIKDIIIIIYEIWFKILLIR